MSADAGLQDERPIARKLHSTPKNSAPQMRTINRAPAQSLTIQPAADINVACFQREEMLRCRRRWERVVIRARQEAGEAKRTEQSESGFSCTGIRACLGVAQPSSQLANRKQPIRSDFAPVPTFEHANTSPQN